MKTSKELVDHFDGFQDYWHLVKSLNEFQRDTLFSSLPKDQQERLFKSFIDGGWEDLFMRNKLDKLVEDIKKEINQDLINIRCRLFMGKCHYMKLSEWKYIKDRLSECASKPKHLQYLLSGIKVELEGEDTVCLTFSKD